MKSVISLLFMLFVISGPVHSEIPAVEKTTPPAPEKELSTMDGSRTRQTTKDDKSEKPSLAELFYRGPLSKVEAPVKAEVEDENGLEEGTEATGQPESEIPVESSASSTPTQ